MTTDYQGGASLGYQAYKLAGAAWVTFVLVYLPLVLITERFTIVPDTGWEIGVVVAGALLGGIGPHGPREERERAALRSMGFRDRDEAKEWLRKGDRDG